MWLLVGFNYTCGQTCSYLPVGDINIKFDKWKGNIYISYPSRPQITVRNSERKTVCSSSTNRLHWCSSNTSSTNLSSDSIGVDAVLSIIGFGIHIGIDLSVVWSIVLHSLLKQLLSKQKRGQPGIQKKIPVATDAHPLWVWAWPPCDELIAEE